MLCVPAVAGRRELEQQRHERPGEELVLLLVLGLEEVLLEDLTTAYPRGVGLDLLLELVSDLLAVLPFISVFP